MPSAFSRRRLFHLAAGAAVGARILPGQETVVPPGPVEFPSVVPYEKRSLVAVMQGENRRKIVHDALVAVDRDIRPVLKTKKYVVIKPNNVSTTNQLAATNVDTL